MSNNRNIFSTPDCLPLDDIIKYLNNQSSLIERHRIEKHMLECELCNEAMEGYTLLDNKERATGVITELNKGFKFESDSVFDIRKVAAGVAAILILGGGLFYLNYNTSKDVHIAVKKDNSGKLKPGVNDQSKHISSITIETKPDKNANREEKVVNNPLEIPSDGYLRGKSSSIPSLDKSEEELNKKDITPPSVKEEQAKDKQDENLFNAASKPSAEPRISVEPEEISESKENINNKKSSMLKRSNEVAPAPVAAPKPAPPVLYEKSYKKELNVETLESGIQKYEEKKYKEASAIFETIIKIDSANSKALYYNGLSYYDSGFLEKALDNFGRVNSGMAYFEDAQWNRALILIRKGDKILAKKMLIEISSGSGMYKNKAREELKKLE